MNKRNILAVLLVGLLVFGMVFIACGDDDDPPEVIATEVSRWVNIDDFGDGDEPYQTIRLFSDGVYIIVQDYFKEGETVEQGTYVISDPANPFEEGNEYTFTVTWFYPEQFFNEGDPGLTLEPNGNQKSDGTVAIVGGEIVLLYDSWHEDAAYKANPTPSVKDYILQQ